MPDTHTSPRAPAGVPALDPDRPLPALFPGASGKGVRIAVIDSGVHPDHPHITPARIAPGVQITREGALIEAPEATLDQLGHGTAVTAAILEKAPEATCLPVRVFADKLSASAAALVAGVRWAIAQEVDLINLSLGSPNPAHEAVFAQVVAQAQGAGIALVAAHDAQGTPCLPGQLPGVLGVRLDWDCPRARCLAEPAFPGTLTASGYPRAIPGVAHTRNLYGISFAVAQVTGLTALACEARRSAGRAPATDPAGALRQALVEALARADG
ncbi:S8 family serine peptidase [Novosphingobium sp. 1949]|uniref:S8 family serine peptidase n=1 Tax=Novosphingobium organovorum TaxID=2930092 RepID=A0ABT0BIJ1_9SPHN|nr:S8 family serine peptidase [Novosphingobium organovorum]MCJ2184869.1 S8 family serine peptidase [Novosphingobium organovorum]